MFMTVHKEYAVKINKQQIKTLADFFKSLPDIKPFNEIIGKTKYQNAFLIKDFQETMVEISNFIFVVETLIENNLIYLYMNPKLKESVNIIQKSHLSQKYELSIPIMSRTSRYRDKEIRIKDNKCLEEFIARTIENKPPRRKPKISISTILLLLFTAIIAIWPIYTYYDSRKNNTDKPKPNPLPESSNNKAGIQDKATPDQDSLETTGQKKPQKTHK